GATRAADPDARAPFGSDADATRTMAMPVVGRDLPGRTVAHGFGNPEDPTVVGGPAADATELMPLVGDGPGGRGHGDTGHGEDVDDFGEGAGAEPPKRSRRTAVVSAAVVFTLVMLVIL